MSIRKGQRVKFHTLFGGWIEGTVVSARRDKYGYVLVEARRTDPDVQEARWYRKPSELTVI